MINSCWGWLWRIKEWFDITPCSHSRNCLKSSTVKKSLLAKRMSRKWISNRVAKLLSTIVRYIIRESENTSLLVTSCGHLESFVWVHSHFFKSNLIDLVGCFVIRILNKFSPVQRLQACKVAKVDGKKALVRLIKGHVTQLLQAFFHNNQQVSILASLWVTFIDLWNIAAIQI